MPRRASSSSEHNLLRAAKHIFKLGPKTLVIKRGEHGAMMVHNDRVVFACPGFRWKKCTIPRARAIALPAASWAIWPVRVSDQMTSLRRAMVYGSVIGSFAVEKFGVERLKTLTLREIHARAKKFHRLTAFEL